MDTTIANDPNETENEESISSRNDLRVGRRRRISLYLKRKFWLLFVSFIQIEQSNEEISYQMVRQVLLQPSELTRRHDQEENQRFVKDLRSKPFEEIKSRVHERVRYQ